MTRTTRATPAARGGWTLIEMMGVVSMLAILFVVFGPVSRELIGALGDDPRRLHEQRAAEELIARIGREVRCADDLPDRVDEFARDATTLLIASDGRTRGYRFTGRGVAVLTFADGKLASADLLPLPLTGRFEYDASGGAAAVTVRFEVKSRGSLRPRRMEATFTKRGGAER